MDKNMSETLVRTGPGTAMGHLMRRYWVPILLVSEIAEPDCPPVRVQILGEKLLAFRDSDGNAALIDELHLAIVPVLLGSGEHLLGGLNLPALGYECVRRIEGARATHVTLRKRA